MVRGRESVVASLRVAAGPRVRVRPRVLAGVEHVLGVPSDVAADGGQNPTLTKGNRRKIKILGGSVGPKANKRRSPWYMACDMYHVTPDRRGGGV